MLIDCILEHLDNINDYQYFTAIFKKQTRGKILKNKFLDIDGNIISYRKNRVILHFSPTKKKIFRFKKGKIKRETMFKLIDGRWLADGHSVIYQVNGKWRFACCYESGKPCGEWSEYDLKGRLIEEGSFNRVHVKNKTTFYPDWS